MPWDGSGNGSSPRVRGTGLHDARAMRGQWFIPACAGNGAVIFNARPGDLVHPRVCGERATRPRGQVLAFGSSPRVRGTVEQPETDAPKVRFIPACAGNGQIVGRGTRVHEVHPRVCGERRSIRLARRATGGSSPRVRGTVPRLGRGRLCRRFIPACAGNGWNPNWHSPTFPVHPRVCGERSMMRDTWSIHVGSSPRVRGTVRHLNPPRLTDRFIPACAGNGGPATTTSPRRTVHPRVCGERSPTSTQPLVSTGSSPRVRGTVRRQRGSRRETRFIPACAGNGSRRRSKSC